MQPGTVVVLLASLVAAAALACSSPREDEAPLRPVPPPPVPATASVALDFEGALSDHLPTGFTSARTGPGADGEWVVESYPATGGNVVAQRSMDPTPTRFPLLLLEGYTARDFSLRVRFLAVSGQVDRAAGLVARLQSPSDYLVVRANALENNVRLYTVVRGARSMIAGADVDIPSGRWQELRLDARGSSFAVFLDEQHLFTATDVAFTEAGQIGLWTKADSVTRFDDLRCGPVLPNSPLGR